MSLSYEEGAGLICRTLACKLVFLVVEELGKMKRTIQRSLKLPCLNPRYHDAQVAHEFPSIRRFMGLEDSEQRLMEHLD